MNRPLLECRIPIGVSSSMINRVCLIALSIRSLGGAYADTIVRATVGADMPTGEIITQVMPKFAAFGVEFIALSRERFNAWRGTANANIATMTERLEPPYSAEHVLLLDADVLALKSFDEFLSPDYQDGCAIMAHASPFKDHLANWETLLTKVHANIFNISLHAHSGWGVMEHDSARHYSPPYFNTGVVLMPAEALAELSACHDEALRIVREHCDSYFADQLSFTLAMLKAGLKIEPVSLKFNFPNDSRFDQAFPDELADARFLHFLRDGIIDRERDFESPAAMLRLVKRRVLRGSNELLRKRVEELLPAFNETLAKAGLA